MISSTSNAQIKELEKLQKRAKLRKETKTFVVEGFKMVEEASDRIQKVYISESCFEKEADKRNLAEKYHYEVVSDKVFLEVSDTMSPQGILAIVKMPEYTIETMLQKENPLLLLLEDLRDPGNLGTIMRTAEGAGVDGVILSKDSVDLFNPKVVRSTMGSIFRVPFLYVEDFRGTLNELKKKNIALYSTHLKGTNTYTEENYKKSCGIIIGNEANGIQDDTAAMTDYLVKIPMEGSLESLNAAIAAALMMYEVYRQRRNS